MVVTRECMRRKYASPGETPVLLTHVLEGDVYRETGRFLDEVALEEPVPLRFRLADLMA